MNATPTEDDAFGQCNVHGDGQALLPAYLFEVEAPAQSRGGWDCYKLLATVRAE